MSLSGGKHTQLTPNELNQTRLEIEPDLALCAMPVKLEDMSATPRQMSAQTLELEWRGSCKITRASIMEALENITYDELNVGDSATYTKTLTEAELVLFAAVSGDVNPVHVDPEYASTTMFKGRIAHGMWSGALISAALATIIPGPGTIYLEQSLQFKKPVRLDDTLTVRATVLSKEARNRVVIDCVVVNQRDEVVVTGQAKVIAPTEKLTLDRPKLPAITIGETPE